VKGNCEPKCTGGQVRNAQGRCVSLSILGKIKKFLKERKEKKDAKAIAEWKERFKNLPEARIVCDGKGGFRPQLNQYEDAPCGVEECARIHEETHIVHWKGNEEYKNWCVGPLGIDKPKGTVVTIPNKDNPFYRDTQCKAFTADSKCLETKRSKNPSSACKTLLTEEVRKSERGRLEYCKF
jgi:hypothetical protein